MATLSIENLKKTLSELCSSLNLLSCAILSLDDKNKKAITNELSKTYRQDNPSIASDYIICTLARRSDPFAERNWAKSYLCIAVPLEIIPKLTIDMPSCEESQELYIASYGGHLDYHIFCSDLIENFLEKFSDKIQFKFKSEICVDIKAVPEKILAKFAKLGQISYNGCLICNNRTDFFLASAFIDLQLPSVSLSDNSSFICENCQICLKKCPGGALQKGVFLPQKCISYLTIEKKGELSSDEKSIIEKNIFGCDICTSSCPNSTPKQKLTINKDWLNSLTQKKFKTIFRKSPVLYAGLKKLKRNANT